jgi:hypothetical protein
MELPTLANLVVARSGLLSLHALPPVRRNLLEVVHRMDPGCLHQVRLGASERFRIRLPGRNEHTDGGHRQIVGIERSAERSAVTTVTIEGDISRWTVRTGGAARTSGGAELFLR